eukprot:47329-Chlamydomonas_euryale.AAC.3
MRTQNSTHVANELRARLDALHAELAQQHAVAANIQASHSALSAAMEAVNADLAEACRERDAAMQQVRRRLPCATVAAVRLA